MTNIIEKNSTYTAEISQSSQIEKMTAEIEEYKNEIGYLKQTNQTFLEQGTELIKVQTILNN